MIVADRNCSDVVENIKQDIAVWIAYVVANRIFSVLMK